MRLVARAGWTKWLAIALVTLAGVGAGLIARVGFSLSTPSSAVPAPGGSYGRESGMRLVDATEKGDAKGGTEEATLAALSMADDFILGLEGIPESGYRPFETDDAWVAEIRALNVDLDTEISPEQLEAATQAAVSILWTYSKNDYASFLAKADSRGERLHPEMKREIQSELTSQGVDCESLSDTQLVDQFLKVKLSTMGEDQQTFGAISLENAGISAFAANASSYRTASEVLAAQFGYGRVIMEKKRIFALPEGKRFQDKLAASKDGVKIIQYKVHVQRGNGNVGAVYIRLWWSDDYGDWLPLSLTSHGLNDLSLFW